jgi:hypothetical protein
VPAAFQVPAGPEGQLLLSAMVEDLGTPAAGAQDSVDASARAVRSS